MSVHAFVVLLSYELVRGHIILRNAERCSLAESLDCPGSDSALLQASVGKQRITLAETGDERERQAVTQVLVAPLSYQSVQALALLRREADSIGLIPLSILAWCILVVSSASCYRSSKNFPQAVSSRPEQDFNDWTSGPFECSRDSTICFWACLCPCIRWADNMDMLSILGYWVIILIFCGLVLLNTVPGGAVILFTGVLLWMAYFRQQLRKKFDMEHSTFNAVTSDLVLYCYCWTCAIAQEARHIEEACRSAHTAVRKHEVV